MCYVKLILWSVICRLVMCAHNLHPSLGSREPIHGSTQNGGILESDRRDGDLVGLGDRVVRNGQLGWLIFFTHQFFRCSAVNKLYMKFFFLPSFSFCVKFDCLQQHPALRGRVLR